LAVEQWLGSLIIERGEKLYGVEIKATATPVPKHAGGLAKWLELAGPSAKGALVPAAWLGRLRYGRVSERFLGTVVRDIVSRLTSA